MYIPLTYAAGLARYLHACSSVSSLVLALTPGSADDGSGWSARSDSSPFARIPSRPLVDTICAAVGEEGKNKCFVTAGLRAHCERALGNFGGGRLRDAYTVSAPGSRSDVGAASASRVAHAFWLSLSLLSPSCLLRLVSSL